jgi:hypothetical protein
VRLERVLHDGTVMRAAPWCAAIVRAGVAGTGQSGTDEADRRSPVLAGPKATWQVPASW